MARIAHLIAALERGLKKGIFKKGPGVGGTWHDYEQLVVAIVAVDATYQEERDAARGKAKGRPRRTWLPPDNEEAQVGFAGAEGGGIWRIR